MLIITSPLPYLEVWPPQSHRDSDGLQLVLPETGKLFHCLSAQTDHSGQPYRIAGSMPPPSLPYSSRHSTAPPDWGHSVGQGSYIAQPDFSYPEPSGMRRFRSVTPSAIYQPTNIPAGTVSGPVPLGWGPAPPQQMAPYQFSYWRPPSEMQYTVPMTPSIATPVGDTPVMNGYDMAAQTPITYVDPSTESYPTPTAE